MKKIMVLVMTIVMVLMLAACGNSHELKKTERYTSEGVVTEYYFDGVEVGKDVYESYGGK